MLSLLLSIVTHPVPLAVGIALGFLCPGSVSKAVAWIKSKL